MSLMGRWFGRADRRLQRVARAGRRILGQALERLEDRCLLTAFTPGNLLVLRVGDGSPNPSLNAAAVSLLEISADSGSVIQTINVPSNGTGALTIPGTSNLQGLLSLSGNGNLVTFAGYRVDAGSPDPATTSGVQGQVPRVIGVVGADGVVNTTQEIGTGGDQSFWNNQFRSVVTRDGSSFWVSGAHSGSNGGVRYVASNTATSSTALLPASNNNTRQLQILNGNLYMTTGSSTPGRTVFQVGTGLPTTGPASLTPTHAFSDSSPQDNSFYFTDLNPTLDWNGTGFDTLYVATTTNIALYKYSFDGTNWIAKGNLSLAGVSNVVGATLGTNVFLAVTNGTSIQTFFDGSGQTGTISGAFQFLAPAGGNFAFRGITFVPGSNPTNINLDNAALDENNATPTTVGSFTTAPGVAESFKYTLVPGDGGDDNALFSITGQDLKANTTFDFETKSSYSIRVRTSDFGGRFSFEKSFTITVNNLNDSSPVFNAGTDAFSVAEGSLAVGTVSAADPDGPAPALTYSISGGADEARFNINTSTGALVFLAAPDFESPTDVGGNNEYEVQVSASDGVNAAATQNVAVSIQDVNEPPSIALANALTTLAEDASTAPAIKVADIIVTDDALGTESFILSGDDAALFEIVGNEMFLKAGIALDYETNASLDVTVQVDDALLGSTFEDSKALSIPVTDVNEPPSVALANTLTRLAEDASTATPIKVADILLTDDALGAEAFSLSGDDAALFEIVGSELFLRAGTVLDAETNASLDATVEVDDDALGSSFEDSVSLAISITNVNEKPAITFPGGPQSFTENRPPKRLAGGALVDDSDSPEFDGGTLIITIVSGLDANDRLGVLQVGSGPGQIGLVGSDVQYEGSSIGTIDAVHNGTGGNSLEIDLNGGASVAAVQALVRAITFQTVGDNPSTTPRSIDFMVSDGDGATSDAATKQVNVSAVNDRPSMPFGGSRPYTEGGRAVQLVANAPVSDVDDANFMGGRLAVTITTGAENADQLSILERGGITVDSNTNDVLFNGDVIGAFSGGINLDPLVVSFTTADAAPAAVKALIESIGYRNDSQNPTPGPHVVQFVLNDGTDDSIPRTRTVNVIAVNDPPRIARAGGTIGYVRNAPAFRLFPAAFVVEDQPTFDGGRLAITNTGAHAQDRILIRGPFTLDEATNKVYFGDVATGTHIGERNAGGGYGTDLAITFNAAATTAIVDELVRSIRFRTHGGAANGGLIGTRLIRFQLTDSAGLAGNVATKMVNVT